MGYNKGRLTKAEIQYIIENVKHKTYPEIAEHLNRDKYSIKGFIEKKLNLKTSLTEGKPVVKQHSITERDWWPILQQKLTVPELDKFLYHWDKITEQFDNDILPTEEIQLIDIITADILSDRCLINQKRAMEEIRNLELQLENKKTSEDTYKMIQNQLLGYNQALSSMGREYKDLIDQKNRLLEKVKGTRADRIKRIDNKRESFINWIEEIVANPERRRELGRKMEKMRLAMLDEEVRLSAYHKYEDGKVDQPLLNSKTVKKDNV